MPNINQLDARIIKILLENGRTGYDEIAKECGVSKNKVWKRCMSMKKKGIINGATVQINFGLFGYDALATLLINVESQQMEQVMDFIGKITEVRSQRQYYSAYNIRAVAALRDLNELDHVKQVIKRKLPTMGLKTYIWTGVRNIPENLNLTGTLEDTGETNQRNLSGTIVLPSEGIVVDDLDKRIVEKLNVDGRESFTSIAKDLGLSTDTVVKRYHKLRKNGALKVSVQINPNKIGYASILDFNIAFTASGALLDTVVESLAKIPDVIIITKTSGDYDLQVTAMVRDISESFAIQDQIARTCGVTKMEASARKIPDKWPTPQQYITTF
ncbi:MAG TPA: Lrp/AsnC family transcriptional regulator [Candidatus Binatia bacterium]|nr:Lrp/AsnC family transcriptional regulator [Candidatus Binatia bacterium]